MVKHEIKVELNKTEELKKIIEKAYFQEGLNGKILGNEHYLTIDKKDDINWAIFNGLHNATVKITNEDIIDGAMRFIVEEQDELKLYPISIYCIKEDDKYIFY